ncbi:hypothetical protein BJ6T_69180 [Bradyrhizobium japonicum USDA 6]|nr:hypothetical protein BJ6T_69180 [Bradyrhizobium japonicum USDA 6]
MAPACNRRGHCCDRHAAGPRRDPARPRSIAAIRKDRPKEVFQSNVPGQNSFGIKPCPARSDRQLTTILGRPLTIKISVLEWMHLRLRNPSSDASLVGCLRTAPAEGAASVKSQTIALSSIDRQTPDYHSSIQSAKL